MSGNQDTPPVVGPQLPYSVVPDSGTNTDGVDDAYGAAQELLKANFDSFKTERGIISQLLLELRDLQPQREPFLRDSQPWSARGLNDLLHKDRDIAESGIMTVVGEAMPLKLECTRCKEKKGIWARCVVVPGADGRGLTCNNCHPFYIGSGCEKYVPPDAGTAYKSVGQRRRTSHDQDDDKASLDSNTWNFEPEALGHLVEENYRRACENEDAYECGQLRDDEVRSLRRTAYGLLQAYRDLQLRENSMDN
ncbi:unnamed protein product [Penicillium bialowiezense]